ncbi:putative membrane protein [Clostridium bornimense]|uniref:peptidylprolyl isomerase n=1 Tax=Clostridium bornimense TaxID=1216932 RepID=W6S5M6_9CLOT|nr:SurA N-terminal domain-containing protein [Clostridium bornimense]CDM69652.1 putative membrane protein [Clostridium bornimense]
MKRVRNTVIAMGIILSTIGLTSCTFIERTDAAKGKQVVAKVGDTEIKRSDVEEKMTSYKDTLKEKYGDNYLENDEAVSTLNQAKQSELDNLIYVELVNMYIKDNNIKIDDTKKQEYVDEKVNYYKEQLGASDDKDFETKAKEQLGVTVDEMKEILGNMYLTQCATNYLMEPKTTDDAIKEYKEENKDDYETKSKQKAVLYIVNKDKEQIEAAKKEIDAGKTIDEIASTYSTDSGKENNGFFGFMDTESEDMSSIDANFVNAVKGLEVGKTSDIVESVDLQFGYFIIGVVDTDTGIKYELKKNAMSNGIYSDLKEIYKDKLKTYEKKLTN